MRNLEIPRLRRLPLFRELLQANLEGLLANAYAQSLPAGLELFHQGDHADFLHVVIEGAVELYAGWADRQCTMAIIHPVGSFILAACITDAPYLMSARTLERSRLLLIPASDLRATFRRDSAFAVSVINELAGAYRAMVRHAKGLKLRDSRERVGSYLLRQSKLAGNENIYHLPIEKRYLASYLGMSAENLSRTLKFLETKGVTVAGGRVTITDKKKLEEMARLDPLLDGPDPESILSNLPLPKLQA